MMNAEKPVFYLIAGANGSGKTTLARELLRNEEIEFLNADEIAAEIKDRVGLASGKILLKKLDDTLTAKKTCAVESTISGKHHLKILEKARTLGYEVIFIYVFLDNVNLNIARVRRRVLLGGHNVPEADIRRRYERSIANFQKARALSDRWELYYNGGGDCDIIARGNAEEEVFDNILYTCFKGLTDA
jgi:predicted ABC-type ATPase